MICAVTIEDAMRVLQFVIVAGVVTTFAALIALIWRRS